MRYIEPFSDERFTSMCVHCGGPAETGDHAPSRILLDEPYPSHLPKLPCCDACNRSFSLDEEYFACLIDCTIAGSADPSRLQRDKVRRTLAHSPELVNRIMRGRQEGLFGDTIFNVEVERVRRIVLKLARCHVAHECSEPQLDEPERVLFLPLIAMADAQRNEFETIPSSPIWPEVGSRGFQYAALGYPNGSPWLIVQEGRYRYVVATPAPIIVRMVLSEYLACEVIWS